MKILTPLKKKQKYSFRGRPLTCRICNCQFKFLPSKKVQWIRNQCKCPDCSTAYCTLIEMERVLRLLQDDFFMNDRDNRYITKIYKYLKMYAESLIKKNFSNNIVQSQKKIEYHSHNASTLLIEEYYRCKCKLCKKLVTYKNDCIGQVCKCETPSPLPNTFKIDTSFGGFLFMKIKESLWGKKEYWVGDVSIDYDYEDEQGSTFKNQYEDTNNSIDNIKEVLHVTSLLDNIIEVIDLSSYYCEDLFINFQRLIALNIYLNQGEIKTDKFFKLFSRYGKDEFQGTLKAIKHVITQGVN